MRIHNPRVVRFICTWIAIEAGWLSHMVHGVDRRIDSRPTYTQHTLIAEPEVQQLFSKWFNFRQIRWTKCETVYMIFGMEGLCV